jgi:hypothetical protein
MKETMGDGSRDPRSGALYSTSPRSALIGIYGVMLISREK